MGEPVGSLSDFKRKYPKGSWKKAIEEFIRKAPEFPDELDLASQIGEVVADLEAALANPGKS